MKNREKKFTTLSYMPLSSTSSFSSATLIFLLTQPLSLCIRTGWRRTMLAYRKNDHSNWSGNNTCTSFMSTVVKIARQRNISFDEIKLDSTDKLYPGDSKTMLQEEMEDYGGK